MSKYYIPIAPRLLAQIDYTTTPRGCWPWTGRSRHTFGYGRINYHGRERWAHSLIWELSRGELPTPGLVVRHVVCGNGQCCRPSHLTLGTVAQNAADMVRMGRSTIGDRNPSRLYPERVQRGDGHWSHRRPDLVRKGSDHHSAKLTESDVREIRARWASGLETQRAIAASKGIGYKLVNDVVHRRSWPHLA